MVVTYLIFIWTVPIGVTFMMCIDNSSHTQHIPCDRFIVWLLVSTLLYFDICQN